ncbi:hypothetical protein SAMN02745945_01512 [Peptoclostridium litorale DSM 5388]|uniref:Lipoprotein n=1 Tax=Peptoclostridium litorale DSM 5388 TaxID=1121324 RepID=A0A069RF87_PEPLI|nr:hypothetical protein [Peptoclostridium litorale]KDR95661.1 hypothetical protein CLIT_10c03880 [Peptoclostridium litorale DSM 5388]SIO00512.1 hypothetical protein SAMN02745945_01512 [Peptoclostridium litorale DSM 5388]
MSRKTRELFIFTLIAIMVFTACAASPWEYEMLIEEPITVKSDQEKVKMGDLEKDKTEVVLDAGAFDKATEVTLKTPEGVPDYASEVMTPLGSPIEIVADSGTQRLNKPAVITMKLEDDEIQGLKKGDAYAIYHDGGNWQPIKPHVDLDKKTLTFKTYHVSIFGKAKVTLDGMIMMYASDKAIESWLQEQYGETEDPAQIAKWVSLWKNEEVKGAYNAYKNGASGEWGYNVKKGDFEEVWKQMKGAARQLELQEIKAQEKAEFGIGFGDFTGTLADEQKEDIRALVKPDLQSQFEQRLNSEESIQKNEDQIKMVLGMYKDAGFIEKGQLGWGESHELEQRLDQLVAFSQKVLRDTGREEFVDGSMHSKEKVSLEELKIISLDWFADEQAQERWKKYTAKVEEIYGLKIMPQMSDIVGDWNTCTLYITEFILPEFTPEELEAQGCDLEGVDIEQVIEEALAEIKRTPTMGTMTITLDENGQGTMNVITEGDELPMNAVYKDGTIRAEHSSEEDGDVLFMGDFSKRGDKIAAEGTWQITVPEEKEMVIKGTWFAVK